jgi:hypothetical protein
MNKIGVLVAALSAGAGAAHADLVAYWAFQSTVPASADNFKMSWPIAADLKANAGPATLDTDARKWDGTLTSPTALQQGALQHFTGTLLNAVSPFAAGADLSIRSLNGDSNGKSFILAFDNSNFADLILSYADRYTSTGPTDVAFSYSTDGVNYIDIPAAAYNTTGFRDSTYRVRTVDLSAVDALDNLSSAFIKITFSGFSTTSSTGNARLDNILISGTLIPTPGTASLFALAGLAAARRRRR